MSIGMPYELFWHGDPNLVKAYREAHELRNQQRNEEMWAQGIYILRALRSELEKLAQGLSGSKGGKTSEYPSEPIPFTEAEQKAATERNKKRTLAWVDNGQH